MYSLASANSPSPLDSVESGPLAALALASCGILHLVAVQIHTLQNSVGFLRFDIELPGMCCKLAGSDT